MHVLGLPPAFVLSQDQTLKFNWKELVEWPKPPAQIFHDVDPAQNAYAIHPVASATERTYRSAQVRHQLAPPTLPFLNQRCKERPWGDAQGKVRILSRAW